MDAPEMTLDFPHGTTEGYRRGCHGSGACPGGYGQTCAAARTRANADWRYSKAVGNDREVEFLEREHAAATPPAKTAKVTAAAKQQRKQARVPEANPHEGQPAKAYENPTAEERAREREERRHIERGTHPDGRPFHAPEPPLPLTPTIAPAPAATGFEVHPRRASAQTASKRKSDGQFAAHVKQRAHALATSTPEHPLGLSLNGTPRKRAAAGTAIGADGKLHDISGLTNWKRTTSPGAAAIPPAAMAPLAPEPPVTGATTDDVEDAAREADRVAALLANTDWRAVARSLGRIADAMEKLRGLA